MTLYASYGRYRHGHHGHHRRTDFGSFQHPQLIKMLYDSDPKAISAAVDAWDGVGRSLHDRASDMERQLEGFENMWAGGAAQQYEVMIKDLAAGIRQVATNALDIRDSIAGAGEALQDARNRMPAAVAVPELSPATRAMAAVPPNVEGMTPAEATETLTLYAQARSAAQDAAAAQAASNSAQSSAAVIMTELATKYNTFEDAIPDTPTAGSLPSATDPGGVGSSDPTIDPIGIAPGTDAPTSGIDPVTGQPLVTRSLFGNVFTAGLAAASAALGGRFAPAVTDLIRRNTSSGTTSGLPGQGTVPVGEGGVGAGVGAGAGAGGAGGGGAPKIHLGGGGGGGGGGASIHAPAPTGSGTLSGAPGGSALSGLGAAGVAAAAAKAGTAGGFMPAMPMGMMGAGDGGMGGGRRIPPWLVETEDVWGESSVVAPSVIGEDGEISGNPW